MGTSKMLWVQPHKMLADNLRWTSIPSRGSRNSPSRFILLKPEISAGLMGLLADPITIGGKPFFFYLSYQTKLNSNLSPKSSRAQTQRKTDCTVRKGKTILVTTAHARSHYCYQVNCARVSNNRIYFGANQPRGL